MFLRGLLCVTLLLLPACKKVETVPKHVAVKAAAQLTKSVCVKADIPSPPALAGRVTDTAAVFDTAAETRLENQLADWEKSSGHQMVAVTIPTLSGIPIESYACTLANTWGIGDKERNDGVLILYAIEDRQVRIAVGKGLESKLTNAYLQDVIVDDMMPELGKQRYEAATDIALDRIVEKLGD
jgi:uncharacterized protein